MTLNILLASEALVSIVSFKFSPPNFSVTLLAGFPSLSLSHTYLPHDIVFWISLHPLKSRISNKYTYLLSLSLMLTYLMSCSGYHAPRSNPASRTSIPTSHRVLDIAPPALTLHLEQVYGDVGATAIMVTVCILIISP